MCDQDSNHSWLHIWHFACWIQALLSSGIRLSDIWLCEPHNEHEKLIGPRYIFLAWIDVKLNYFNPRNINNNTSEWPKMVFSNTILINECSIFDLLQNGNFELFSEIMCYVCWHIRTLIYDIIPRIFKNSNKIYNIFYTWAVSIVMIPYKRKYFTWSILLY